MMIEMHMEPDPELTREVFARFGLAMYRAQCLERELAIILATKYGPGPFNVSRTEFNSIFEKLFSKSLGQLVSNITQLSALSEDEEERLKAALEKRNWLVHRYFWERVVDLLSYSGLASMIDELQDTADIFESLDELFTTKTREWGESVGISKELVNEHLERLIKDRDDSCSTAEYEDERF